MPAWNPRANEVFLAALEIEDSAERNARVQAACGDDAELRRQVEALLRAHGAAGSFLEEPAARPDVTADYRPPDVGPDSRVGPYRLLEQIGEGGFGLVFLAEQEQPVKRRVALKVLKPGMDSRQVVARFEAERHALALMDHPNIARVIDAGTTDAGRPYFVMELVRGIPITQYCDQNQMSPAERLQLFVTVCQAIQHAHQKGIIHRDIKPSNVLVTAHDGRPVAKVIDFGVAKAIGGQLGEHTVRTNFAQMIGTPLYMSPEQAELSGQDIDTRSDIYSLGVLLYELLTGTTPLERKRFAEAAYDEIRRLIREEEPPKPSTRLSSSDSLASVAARRRIEPAKLSRLLRGDLDWIVMKCLEKDRTRRYETANGLAVDLQRFLADEPVAAGPPSAIYRFRKFVRRNRTSVVAAALVLAALVFGVIGTGVGFWRARAEAASRQEAWAAEQRRAEEAEEATRKEARARRDEAEQRAVAERRLGQIEKGNEVLAGVFRDLNLQAAEKGADPLPAQLGRRLVAAARQLDADVIGDPLVLARLQSSLGGALLNLGHYRPAREVLGKAAEIRTARLGPDDSATLDTLSRLAAANSRGGRKAEALALYEAIRTARERTLGPDHRDALAARAEVAGELLANNRTDEGIQLYEATLRKCEEKLDATDSIALHVRHDLATAYYGVNQFAKALPLLEDVARRRESQLGADHITTLNARNSLAATYQALNRLDESVTQHEAVLLAYEGKLGLDNPETINARNNLAAACRESRRFDRAVNLFQQNLKIQTARFGPDSVHTYITHGNLGGTYQAMGQLSDAITHLATCKDGLVRKLGRDHTMTDTTLSRLSSACLAAGRFAEMAAASREMFDAREARRPGHWSTFVPKSQIGVALIGQKKFAEAEPILVECYDGFRKHQADIPPKDRRPYLVLTLHSLIAASNALGKPDDAAMWQAEMDKLKR